MMSIAEFTEQYRGKLRITLLLIAILDLFIIGVFAFRLTQRWSPSYAYGYSISAILLIIYIIIALVDTSWSRVGLAGFWAATISVPYILHEYPYLDYFIPPLKTTGVVPLPPLPTLVMRAVPFLYQGSILLSIVCLIIIVLLWKPLPEQSTAKKITIDACATMSLFGIVSIIPLLREATPLEAVGFFFFTPAIPAVAIVALGQFLYYTRKGRFWMLPIVALLVYACWFGLFLLITGPGMGRDGGGMIIALLLLAEVVCVILTIVYAFILYRKSTHQASSSAPLS